MALTSLGGMRRRFCSPIKLYSQTARRRVPWDQPLTAWRAMVYSRTLDGNVNQNSAPPSTRGRYVTSPSCARAKVRAMASPIPSPPCCSPLEPRWRALKINSISSAFIPGPRSATTMRVCAPSRTAHNSIGDGGGAWRAAFCSRLPRTCSDRRGCNPSVSALPVR